MRRSLGKLPEGKQDSDAHTEDKRETPRQTLGGTEGSKRERNTKAMGTGERPAQNFPERLGKRESDRDSETLGDTQMEGPERRERQESEGRRQRVRRRKNTQGETGENRCRGAETRQ